MVGYTRSMARVAIKPSHSTIYNVALSYKTQKTVVVNAKRIKISQNELNRRIKHEKLRKYSINVISKWWNVDKWANSCNISGSVKNVKGEYLRVTVVALHAFSGNSKVIKSKDAFIIRSLINKKVRIIVSDFEGNVGVSKIVTLKKKDYALDVGTIILKPIPKHILKNKKRMIKYLGLTKTIK